MGLGFAATRDIVSFLRHEKADADGTPNLLAARLIGPSRSAPRRVADICTIFFILASTPMRRGAPFSRA